MQAARVLASLVATVLLLTAGPMVSLADDHGPSVVVHIGHATDDLHAASMGMSLARMLQRKGATVTVFLDREGVRLAARDMPKDLGWGKKGDPVVAIMADLVAAGGRVLLCPHCARAGGVAAGDVVDGARIATGEFELHNKSTDVGELNRRAPRRRCERRLARRCQLLKAAKDH